MSLLDQIKKDNEDHSNESTWSEEQEIFWDYHPKYEIVESEIWDQRRWVTVHRDIVKHADYPGEFVEILYEQGSTEMQEADADSTTFNKVVPKEVTVTKYVRVEN